MAQNNRCSFAVELSRSESHPPTSALTPQRHLTTDTTQHNLPAYTTATITMPTFIPGLTLNRLFYQDVLKPLLASTFPSLQYSAALIGPGSEVLGFDTSMSADHDWGIHFFIFVRDQDESLTQEIANCLSHRLPTHFHDFPVSIPPVSPTPFVRLHKEPLVGPVGHHITPITITQFVIKHLRLDVTQPMQPDDWLTIPWHAIGDTVAGEVFHDGTGQLTQLREKLAWYPRDVWIYLLAAGWQRIAEEEHLMPRAGYAGSELGSAIIGSRLVRDVMHLCFLMERKYPPYAKWLGLAFRKLKCGQELETLLRKVQQASTWQGRQDALVDSLQILAKMHNTLELTEPINETASGFYDRPFQVIHAESFAQALRQEIRDPQLRSFADRHMIGGISQWSDSAPMLEHMANGQIRSLYTA